MRLFSPHFPAGRSGAGLLFLRLSAALALLVTPGLVTTEALRWPVTLLAAVLILGFGTRAAAILCLGALSVGSVHAAELAGWGAQILQAAAIGLLGPGAYSADAMMFGRRTILLQRRPD